MTAYITNILHSFFGPALTAAMLYALWRPFADARASASIGMSIVSGLLAGAILYLAGIKSGMPEMRTYLYISAFLISIPAIAGVVFANKINNRSFRMGRIFFFAFISVLFAAGGFQILSFISVSSLSMTAALNTDAILDIGAMIAGVCFVAFASLLSFRMCEKAGSGAIAALIVLISALSQIRWIAEIVQGLIRLDVLELTGMRVSFVAKTMDLSSLFVYAQILFFGILSFVYFRRRHIARTGIIQNAEKRKETAIVLKETRRFGYAAALIAAFFSILLYHDLYASRPPKITAPVRLTPDENGNIRIKIEDAKDGRLHRFSYITGDGHVVRFFLINRYKDRTSIGVVYDACMICGDMGYLQNSGEVVCIACNVRIFNPSIGKPGGCNPIPLKHFVDGEDVVISSAELDNGAKYFSEVVSVKVKDPVTGKEMTNDKAPFRYEYGGRTYYFEAEGSRDKFMNSPEAYISEKQARYFRAQGYQ
jgi:uncharacterized membrane protein/YHS domain-containing protein